MIRSKFTTALVVATATLVFAVIGAASASATRPEFKGPFPNKFELKASSVVLETVAKRTVTCSLAAISGAGEITGAKAANVAFTLKACSTKTVKGSCTETKATELEGMPVYVNNHEEVGLLLQPKAGANFAELKCGEGAELENLTVKGSVVGVLTPVNAPETVFNLSIKQEAGVQKPTEYETEPSGKVKAILETEGSGKESFAFEQTGMAAAATEGSPTITTTTATTISALLRSKGKPEFSGSPEGIKFTGNMIGTPTFHGPLQSVWDYFTGTITGVITGPNEVANVVLTFNEPSEGGCTNSVGGEKAHVTLNALFGRLGYINKAKKEVGLLLEPRTQPVVKCSRPNVREEWRGSIIARISPVGERTTAHKLKFEANGVKQVFEKFEGEEALHHLEKVQPEGGTNQGPMSLESEMNMTTTTAFSIEA